MKSWLLLRGIDPKAPFAFVPRGAPLLAGAEPFDVPAVRFSDYGGHCPFQALIKHYELAAPILHRIARFIDELPEFPFVPVEQVEASPLPYYSFDPVPQPFRSNP